MRFETDRLILRPWTDDDAESLYKYAKDPAVGPIAGWPVHTSVENSLEIIRNVLSAEGTFAVCLKTDNSAIGSIGFIPPAQSYTKTEESEIEVGYWIGAPFWGNGFIPEAVRALQKYAFEELGCAAMWCGYYDGNEKSKRCQEKCGFKYHHTEKNKSCALMGDVRTEHFTRLTRNEYEVIFRTVGESDWPFGHSHGRLVLKSGESTVSSYNFDVANDGCTLGQENWDVSWEEDGVKVTVSGEEQPEETIILYFDGRIETGCW